MNRFVVGIDPGLQFSGVVALLADGPDVSVLFERRFANGVDSSGTTKNTQPERLVNMTSAVCDCLTRDWVNQALQRPLVAIEEPFAGANSATALLQHGVFSAIVYELTVRRFRVVPVWPATIKKFVGAKKKELLIREVFRRWKYGADQGDLVDAYAIARWALETIGAPP